MDRKNLILGGILAILIIFAYVQQGPWQTWKKSLSEVDSFLKEADHENINKVEIETGTTTTVLEREGENWKIAGTKDFYISGIDANRLKESINEMSKADLEVVSKNKNKKFDFKTGEEGTDIGLYGDGFELDFVLGKTGPTAGSCYVSQKDDSKTYLLDSNIRVAFLKDDWRDKKIFSFMPERADKVRFQYPNREFTVEKVDNVWKGVDPYEFEVDEEKLYEVLGEMGSLKAAEIPEQTFEGTGLEKHNIIVEVNGVMDDYTIMVGDANDEGLYYAKRGDSDNIYLITKEEKEVFEKTISDLQ